MTPNKALTRPARVLPQAPAQAARGKMYSARGRAHCSGEEGRPAPVGEAEIGLAIGAGVGVAMGSIAIGVGVGLALGAAMAAVTSKKLKSQPEEKKHNAGGE